MSAAPRPAGGGRRETARGGQRGGFVMGLVVGLLIGLALSLGVALYITKAPVPFINKVPQRTAEQDSAEVERNRNWDPNAPLGGKGAARAVTPPASAAGEALPADAPPVTGALPPGIAPAPAAAPALRPPARDPAAILAGGGAASAPAARPAAVAAAPAATAVPGGFVFFVQAGAYTRAEDAEQQRARLALAGQTARVTEREQVGRTVYRVRMGPFPTREEADALLGRLQSEGIEAQIVRVERQ